MDKETDKQIDKQTDGQLQKDIRIKKWFDVAKNNIYALFSYHAYFDHYWTHFSHFAGLPECEVK